MRKPQLESRSRRYAAIQNVADYETGAKMSDVVGSALAVSREQGVVKFFDKTKGFGFCKREPGKPDVFVHANALKRSGIEGGVNEGDTLEFDVLAVEGKGPKADRVVVVSRA